jgi:hypothetical protein
MNPKSFFIHMFCFNFAMVLSATWILTGTRESGLAALGERNDIDFLLIPCRNTTQPQIFDA